MTDHRTSTLPLFLAGLGTGIAVTLLLAPLSGSTTRRLIGRRIKNGEDWVRGTAASLRARMTEEADAEVHS